MIPPRTIDEFPQYPPKTLEGIIAREMVSMIRECEDHAINLEPIQAVIDNARALMRDAKWPAIYQHNYLVRLRLDLTELTQCHPVTRQFIQLLTIETEFNSCIQ
jgi:hypothetical protein